MRNSNKRLLTLIKKHGLTSAAVAAHVHVKQTTVEKWRPTPGNISVYKMPLGLLELLEIKLGETTWHG